MGISTPNIFAAGDFEVGVKSDGTVVYAGKVGIEKDGYSRQNFGLPLEKWANIKEVYYENNIAIGLKNDGTLEVFYVGFTSGSGEEPYSDKLLTFLKTWKDIKHLAKNYYGYRTGAFQAITNDGAVVSYSGNSDKGYTQKIDTSIGVVKDIILGPYGGSYYILTDGTAKTDNEYFGSKGTIQTIPQLANVKYISPQGGNDIYCTRYDGTVASLHYNSNHNPAVSLDEEYTNVSIGFFNGMYLYTLYNNGDLYSHYAGHEKIAQNVTNVTYGYRTIMWTCGDNKWHYRADHSLVSSAIMNVENWKLKLDYTGLLKSRKALDFTAATKVDALTIAGILPTDCKKRLVFGIDGTYYKLTQTSGTAALSAVATQAVTADSVFTEGNTVDELAACTNNTPFVGKSVYPVVALYAPDNATAFPTIQMSGNARNNQDTYTKTEYSAEYTLTAGNAKAVPRIISITADTALTGKATATVTVSLKSSDGTWSDYIDLLTAKDRPAVAVKYRAVHTVTVLDGTDTSKVTAVTALYTTGSASVSGDTAEIYTVTQNYEVGLGYAQSVIKHKALIDAELKAFVAFRNEPKQRKMIPLGTGTGSAQTLTLGVAGKDGKIGADSGINQNKLSVYFDGKPYYSYSYNTETSEITVTADAGVAISGSYEYGWEAETWREMTKTTTQPYDSAGTYATYFEYTLPTGEEKKTISNIKYVLYRPSGHITDAALGTATGSRQVFVLPHKAKAETIVCNGSWSYDDDTQILTVVAAQGTALTISYDYIAESQEVYGVTAGWAED